MSAAPQRLNKYELRTPIGRGSAGEVWKAYDLQQHTDVAIKLLHSDLQADPHFFTHFTVEGQAIASLQHDNIVKIHEINVARPAQSNETIAYIAMDYIEGQTLATYIHATSHKANFPTLPQITYLFTCLGKAIDYAHAQGLSHGDLKPSNILLNARDRFQFEGGEPMLTDFALANILGNNVTTASPIYMSPEQAQGQAAIPRSDIYTLGVILYEFCTGVQPFRADSAVEIMKQHINVLPTPPVLINPHVPYALSEVILRAMAKNPSTRFPSASALATAVADACSLQSTNYAPSAQEFDDESDPQQNSSILGVAQPPASNPPRSPRPTHPIQTRPLNIPASLSGLHSNSSEHTATQPTPP
ncbi:MAG TPA: protein kinase, partial [Ktedonobacteraceae bacterium]|nr:protein kinase [Ktedonobacteraceae bacterium]